MKTQEQIEAHLADLEIELDSLKDWMEAAQKQYNEDRKHWGKEADDGEVRYVTDCYNNISKQIKTIKWILA